MTTALWIVQGLLAFAFAAAGLMKLGKSYDALRSDPKMGWANDFSAEVVKLIGAAELAGAIGLVAPAATGVAPTLTPIAAAGLIVIMLGAAATHVRRKEMASVLPNVILAGLAGFVVWQWWA